MAAAPYKFQLAHSHPSSTRGPKFSGIRCLATASPVKSHTITLLPGDGIGPEVVSIAKNALLCVSSLEGFELKFKEMPMGGAALDLTGVPLPEETLSAAKESDAVLLGAIGGYKWDNNEKHLKPETGLLQLREGLKVFANLRPATVLPQCMLRSKSPDLLIFDPEIERTARRLRKARREEIKAMADNMENDGNIPPEARPIRDHFRPVINTHYSGIARGTINANNFELKPALINMVQQNQFGGAATADPHLHLRTFLEITDTELATKFLSKYFPPAKSAQLKIEISTFRQIDFEQLYEARERYKELLRRCPNHGFEDWVQIELFYNGLNGQTRTTVDAAAGGTIFAKSPAQAYDLLEQMTINSYQWPSERSGVKRTAGVYAVDPITSLTAQVSALTTQLAAMNKVSTSEGVSAPLVVEEPHFLEEVQYINNKNFGGYGGYRGNPPPNTYHLGLRNHENFSYANNKNVLNPPPGFNTSNGEGKPSFEDLVGTFVAESGKRMARTESRLDNLETHMTNIGASLKILESQVGQITKQLTSQPSGAVQKTADPNLKEVNAVFIQHEEMSVVSREEKEIEPTSIRD